MDIARELNRICADFLPILMISDENSYIMDTAQLCIFIRIVDKSFKIH